MEISLEGCDCISQNDKEIFAIMIEDALDKREIHYKSDKKKNFRDIELIKAYEKFKDFVSNYKTCQ